MIRLFAKEIEIPTRKEDVWCYTPNNVSRKRVCDLRRCRCYPGDPDDAVASTPNMILAQSQMARMFSDATSDVPT